MAAPPAHWLPAFLRFCSLVQITSKEDGKVPIVPYDAQKRFLTELNTALQQDIHHIVCLKARQLGISTILLALDIFWLFMFEGLQGALVFDNAKNLTTARRLITEMIESLPPEWTIPIKSHNREELVFENGSTLQYMSAGKGKNSGLGRSRALNFVHASEISSWGDQDGIDSLMKALAIDNPNRLYIFESPLALDTPIPTPSGWTTMGEVQVGDQVFNEEGQPCSVVGASPVFTDRRCYRVTFDNGDSIVADAGHKWRIAERRWPTNPQWRVMDVCTSDLDPKKHVIYVTKPLALPDADLPIDPYLLGVWLGDGSSRAPRITASDQDLPAMQRLLEARGLKMGVTTKAANRAPMFTVLGVKEEFLRLGLIGNKHIPPAYLRASEAQRRDLLAGLMDTDGHVHKKTFGCNFTSANMTLLAGVSELLISLGIKHVESLNSADGKSRLFPHGHTSTCKESRRHQFSELPDRQVFLLPRKRRIHETPRNQVWRKTKRLRIVSVEEVDSVPVKCIAVDTPSHLFLAGRTMVPTHNTALGYNVFYDMVEEAKQSSVQHFVFLGWWSKGELYRIREGTAEFDRWWGEAPFLTDEEAFTQHEVQERYHHTITPEQWAWYRRDSWNKSEQSQKSEMPATEEEAFQATGSAFFSLKRVGSDMAFLHQAGSRAGYQGFRYHLGTKFTSLKIEQVSNPDDVELRVWEQPRKGASYVMGVDVAYGRDEDSDRSCISIWRAYADKLVQVAEYATPLPETRQVAWVLAHLAGCYRDSMINLEITGPGAQVMAELKYLKEQIQFGHLRETAQAIHPEWALDNMRWFLYTRPDSLGPNYAYNFKTGLENKLYMMNRFRDSYNTEEVLVRSMPLLTEMTKYVQEGYSLHASGRNKDDRVMGSGLAHFAWAEWVRTPMMQAMQTYDRVMRREQEEDARGVPVLDWIIPAMLAEFEQDQLNEADRIRRLTEI